MQPFGLLVLTCALLSAQNRIEIPFRFATPDLPLVILEVQINNQKGLTAVLDTGQGIAPVLVNQSMARDLGMVFRDSQRLASSFAVGSGMMPVVLKSRVEGLYLGGVALGSVDAGVTTALDAISDRIEQRIAANVGYALLKDYTMSLNYSRLTLTLTRQPLTSKHSFVLGAKRPLAIVEARINGQGPYRFALDTGATHSVISQQLAERLTLPRGIPIPMLGAAGQTNAFMTRAQTIDLAGRRIPDFAFATGDFFDRFSDSVGAPIDGILGANAFQKLVLRIDYPNRRFSLDNP